MTHRSKGDSDSFVVLIEIEREVVCFAGLHEVPDRNPGLQSQRGLVGGGADLIRRVDGLRGHPHHVDGVRLVRTVDGQPVVAVPAGRRVVEEGSVRQLRLRASEGGAEQAALYEHVHTSDGRYGADREDVVT